MAAKRPVQIAAELAEELAGPLGLEIVDVEFRREAGGRVLRVFIDKPGGVTLDDCQALSQELSRKLDEVDPIEESYSLEVSSPGIERPLTKPTRLRAVCRRVGPRPDVRAHRRAAQLSRQADRAGWRRRCVAFRRRRRPHSVGTSGESPVSGTILASKFLRREALAEHEFGTSWCSQRA